MEEIPVISVLAQVQGGGVIFIQNNCTIPQTAPPTLPLRSTKTKVVVQTEGVHCFSMDHTLIADLGGTFHFQKPSHPRPTVRDFGHHCQDLKSG